MTNSVRSLNEGLELLEKAALVLGVALAVDKKLLSKEVSGIMDLEDAAVEKRNKESGTLLNKPVGLRKILLARVDSLPGVVETSKPSVVKPK